MRQLKLLKNTNLAYGGSLRNKRKGRGSRPLATKHEIHLVLRSSKAKGAWSFLLPKNRKIIDKILNKFASKYGIKIVSLANVGNHLHSRIQLTSLLTYKPFIRAITSAIATAITGSNLWRVKGAAVKASSHVTLVQDNADKSMKASKENARFWDYRPFTRVIVGYRNLLNLRKYIRINQLEGGGFDRETAQYIVKHGVVLDTT